MNIISQIEKEGEDGKDKKVKPKQESQEIRDSFFFTPQINYQWSEASGLSLKPFTLYEDNEEKKNSVKAKPFIIGVFLLF